MLSSLNFYENNLHAVHWGKLSEDDKSKNETFDVDNFL
jgi:hypothetical protein